MEKVARNVMESAHRGIGPAMENVLRPIVYMRMESVIVLTKK